MELGRHLGVEAASQDVCVLLGPGVNIKRSPLCGRNFEYFCEDPYLAGKMAAGYVRGIQSEGVSACPKHFAANSQELRRMASDSVMDERTLREIYLTGFEIAVKEGHAKSIMSSYKVGVAAGGGHLQVGARPDALHVVVGAAPVGHHKAVEAPLVPEDLLEQVPVLIGVGAVDAVVGRHDGLGVPLLHRDLKARASEQSIVLLKNEGNILPLKKGAKVAVIGEFAQKARYQGAGSSVVKRT